MLHAYVAKCWLGLHAVFVFACVAASGTGGVRAQEDKAKVACWQQFILLIYSLQVKYTFPGG